ncbi:hypothetical protein CYY_006354 [Polysphondylium violaceum]|uniref:LAA1-like C-terminal TPR repeats domain-containing protein n=1 Tax=Polysphondylium violaceum TaxID=133409 RepID=A0A8J4PSS8_9MYCE|nr:hypothetical protein CYY_006354 [Polysphondylium violaceum]
MDILENHYATLQKAVNDGIKLNNIVSKFDQVCTISPIFNTLSKQDIDSITLKWLNLLTSCLLQGTGGPAFALTLGNLISKLFDYPIGGRSSTSIVKNLIASIQSKQSNTNLKVSVIDVLSIIFKSSKTLAIVYIQEMFTLLSKIIKMSSEPFVLRASAMRCVANMIESSGYGGNSIHLDAFKLIKAIYPIGSTNTSLLASLPNPSSQASIYSYQDFKIECVNVLLPIIKNYNQNDRQFEGFDEKVLSLLSKAMDEDYLRCRNKVSESMGNCLMSLYYKEVDQPPQQQQQSSSSSSVQIKSNYSNVEQCLNYLNNLMISCSGKKEIRVNITIAYSTFLKSLRIHDTESQLDKIIAVVFKLLSPQFNRYLGNLNSTSQSNQVVQEQIQFKSIVSHILRIGLGENQSENGQQYMLRVLSNYFKQHQQQPDSINELVLYCSLRESSILINELGEGGLTKLNEDYHSNLISLLCDKNQSTRQWAGICLRSFATHQPKNISMLLTECLQHLNTSIGEIDTLSIQPDSLKRIMNSLKGNSLGCAALISTVKTTELGVPATLLNQITKISSALLTNPDFINPAITLARLEAGWTIMNSLIKFMGSNFVESILPSLFTFWKSCFNINTVHPTAERDIVIFARTRADALVPLQSFLQYNPKLVNSKVIGSIVNFLSNTLKTVSELPAISTSFQSSTNELTQLLEYNLVQTFLSLPASSFSSNHTTLMTIVTSLILDGPLNTKISAPSSINDSNNLLSKEDEDALLPDFTSVQQSLERSFQIPISTQDSSLPCFIDINDCFSHKCTQFLEIRVVNSAIELFSYLFIAQPDRHRTQLIDHLSNCIKESSNASQKQIMIVNALTSLLYILKSMASNNNRFGKSDITITVQRFVQRYFGDTNPLLRRISSECLGLLCRIEGDKLTTSIIQSLTEIIRKPPKDVPSSVRAGAAFVFGCIQRSVGGMMSQKFLPTTIANLHVLAQDLVSPDVSQYALHSLYITIQTSGFDFTSFAAPTLMLLQSLLVNENPPYQLLGRIVNSIVVALGPELETSKDIMAKCTGTCSIIEKSQDPLIKVESIYFYQKLIMFAPNTINVDTLVPQLIQQLKSPYLLLRVAAVTCLRQLIQKRSKFEMNIPLTELLFMMLDTERDTQLSKELKLLLFSLIDTIAPSNPSTWLKLCMSIILSSKQTEEKDLLKEEADKEAAAKDKDGSKNNDNNDEDEEELDQKVVVEKSSSKSDTYVHRWFTKIFALECVRRVISVVRDKPQHFSMILIANFPNKTDYLVMHLHDLISISYKAATSQIDSMRPIGILLLKDILDGFSKAIDPDYEGHLLLELYQAQIMSALRPAFVPGALPTQLSNACQVFVGFVDASIHYDNVAIKKATTILSQSVRDLRNLNFPIYNEKTTTLVQVSILKAFAQLYLLCLKDESLYQILSSVINPILMYLRVHWTTFLKEHTLLVYHSSQIYPLYRPILFSPLTFQDSIEYFKDAYPHILKALSCLLHTQYWTIGREGSGINVKTEDKEFLSETKGLDDLYIIIGLSLKSMERYLEDPVDINFKLDNVSLSLEIFKTLFKQNFNGLSFDILNEILSILFKINNFKNPIIQSLVLDVLNELILNFVKDDSNNNNNNLMELILKTLYKPINLLNKESNGDEEYFIKLYPCCSSIFNLIQDQQGTDKLKEQYIPLFLVSILMGLSNSNNASLITGAIQLFNLIIKSKVSIDLIPAFYNSLLESLNDQLDQKSIRQGSLLLVPILFANNNSLTIDQIIIFLQKSITSVDISTKEKVYILQIIRNIVNSGASQPSSNLYRLSVGLVETLFNDLFSLFKFPPSTLINEDLEITNEIIKLFVLSLSFSNQDSKSLLLLAVIQSFILFLQPNVSPTPLLHSQILQVLLNFASTQPLFKEAVSRLPTDLKQILEQSIRQNIESTTKKEVKLPPKPQIQLNFDFSKVIKE